MNLRQNLCQLDRPNHSDDLVTVYTGREDGPVRLCGYHASQLTSALLNEAHANRALDAVS